MIEIRILKNSNPFDGKARALFEILTELRRRLTSTTIWMKYHKFRRRILF